MLQHFKGSIVFTVVALILAGLNGYLQEHALAAVASAVFIAAVLGVMETSLSLDNAVVNATVLRDMDEKWVQRFLTWGIAIAVFGMRVVFPIGHRRHRGLGDALGSGADRLVRSQALRGDRNRGAHRNLRLRRCFSGTCWPVVLLRRRSRAFVDSRSSRSRSRRWRRFRMRSSSPPLSSWEPCRSFVEHGAQRTFLIAAASGIATFFAVDLLGEKMGASEDATGKIVRTGAASFVYLEFLDASFSFDGVIGAFAITNDIVQIALGSGHRRDVCALDDCGAGAWRDAQRISLSWSRAPSMRSSA